MLEQGFKCNIRQALRFAGLRFKPMPKRRKQWLRIKRRRQKDWEDQFEARFKEAIDSVVSCRGHYDEVTGMMLTVMRFQNKDGSIREHYDLPMLYV